MKVKLMPDSANSSWNQKNPRTALSMEKILLVRHCSPEPDHIQMVTLESEGWFDLAYVSVFEKQYNAFWTQILILYLPNGNSFYKLWPKRIEVEASLFIPAHISGWRTSLSLPELKLSSTQRVAILFQLSQVFFHHSHPQDKGWE